MAAEGVFVRKDGEGHIAAIFLPNATLEFVARHFDHDCSRGSVGVKTTAGEGLFMVLPLDTVLHQLRQLRNLEGDGSVAAPFIVQVEQTGGTGAGAGTVTAGDLNQLCQQLNAAIQEQMESRKLMQKQMRESCRLTEVIEQMLRERLSADQSVSIPPSGVSSQLWSALILKLDQIAKVKLRLDSSCCFGELVEVEPTHHMVWVGQENDECNVRKAAVDHLQQQFQEQGQISIEDLEDVRQEIIGYYEAKTTDAFKRERLKAIRQAVLQLFAGDAMRNSPDPPNLVVIVGDGNNHYGVHFKDDRSELHVSWPQLKAIPEDSAVPLVSAASAVVSMPAAVVSEGAPAAPPAGHGGTALARKLLAQALERKGPTAGAMPSSRSSGSPDAPPGPSAGLDKRDPSSSSGDGRRASLGAATISALPSKRKATDDTSGAAAGGQASNENAEVGTSSAQEKSCWTASGSDGEFDEDRRQALYEELYTRGVLEFLQRPDVGKALGLSEPPTSLPLLTRDVWLNNLRPMVPDGSGGWR